MEPPAGAAPARLSYKGSLQAAARRQNGLPSRSSKSEGWSQSPVLPWTQRAYETCLSAGSTAMLAHGRHCGRPAEIGAPTRSCTELARLPSERIAANALGIVKSGVPERLRFGDRPA